jgi:hypothetical protein
MVRRDFFDAESLPENEPNRPVDRENIELPDKTTIPGAVRSRKKKAHRVGHKRKRSARKA